MTETEASSPDDSAPAPEPVAGEERRHSLAHFPIAMFTGAMGVLGLGLAWREAAAAFAVPEIIGEAVVGFGTGVYAAVLALYIAKAVRHPAAVIEDCRDPVRANYLAAITMSLILVGIGALPHTEAVGEVLWSIGTAATVAVTVYIVAYCWYGFGQAIPSVTPAWFIPVVANLVAPMGRAFYGYYEISWMLFGIGVFFWLVMATILFYRLLFREPMAPSQKPTMAVQLAPPGLVFIGYVLLGDGYVDGAALAVLGVGLLTTLMLAGRILDYIRLPFGLSWWAFTFPMATMAVATLMYHGQAQTTATAALAIAYLAASTAIVALVLALTLRSAFRGGLLRPQGPAPAPATTGKSAAE